MRRLIGGTLAAFLIVIALPAPAHASAVRREASSLFNMDVQKSATVECGPGKIVVGTGGRINPGGGGVILTAVAPNAALTSVTAVGRATPGHPDDWSVTAFAVCREPGVAGMQAVVSPVGVESATATCPGNKAVYSTGFVIGNPTGTQYVDQILPSATLSRVDVHASGTGLSQSGLVAVALCGWPPMENAPRNRERTEGSSVVDATPVKSASAGLPEIQLGNAWIHGAGARVDGENAFIDAFGPTAGLDGATARAARVTGTQVARAGTARAGAMVAGTDDDDWGLTTYGTCIGAWY